MSPVEANKYKNINNYNKNVITSHKIRYQIVGISYMFYTNRRHIRREWLRDFVFLFSTIRALIAVHYFLPVLLHKLKEIVTYNLEPPT